MRNTIQIHEEINELALKARSIMEAVGDSRKPTEEEQSRFDRIVDIYIPELKNELAKAQLIETSKRQGHVMHGSNQPYSRNTMQSTFMNKTEELDALMRGEPLQPRRHYNQVARTKAFRNPEDALAAGFWLRAVVARTHHNSIDRRAEEECERRGLEVTNTMSEGYGATGGYIVPATISSTVIDVKERVGVARKVCRVLPCPGDTLTVPKRAGGLTVYAAGEGDTLLASDKPWSQVELILKKRYVMTFISQELVDDALINVADDVFAEMGYALALQEDNELINGTGAATTYFGVRGLLNRLGAGGVSTAATGHDTWPELDIADFAACVGKLPDRYQVYGPGWICSHSFFNSAMARIAYAAGGVTMAEVMSGTANVRSFMGYPVYLTSQMPVATATATVCALFGSFDQAVIMADNGGVRLARSDDYKFGEDKISLRATSRYDINVHDFGTASLAGAYVGLKTAS